MMVNRERIQMWVDALRSGKYPQGTQVLTRVEEGNENSHCCMGVACVIAQENGVQLERSTVLRWHGSKRIECILYDDMFGTMPMDVYDWFGIGDSNPYFRYQERPGWGPIHEHHLSALNDDLKLTFPQIADCIAWMYLSGSDDD